MGIRGLTTFITKNSRKYLTNFELHDTYLIIDGNNLSAHLYRWHTKCYDCFGGDYDKYGRAIETFFELLKQCNVDPIVVLDGGYEENKLKTIFMRVKNKIKAGKLLNSLTEGTVNMFPLFARDMFADVLLRLKVKMVRCDYEADLEMACMARTLNCPLLSYDSDFYVFDVLYIPFNSVELKCYKHLQKEDVAYNYIPCQLYKVEHLLKAFGGLKKDVLPLLATVLGNDYIKVKVFSAFYRHIKLPKHKELKTKQQKRIFAITHWLKRESYESAVTKILSRVKVRKRRRIYREIKKIVNVYKCESSRYLDLLGIDYNPRMATDVTFAEINVQQIETAPEDEDAEEEAGEDSPDDVSSDESDDNTEDNVVELDVLGDNVQIANCSETFINKYSLPEWFMSKYRQGVFPAWFMDIAMNGLYFLCPQVEDYTNPHSHRASLDLITALCTMLNRSDIDRLIYVSRNGERMKQFYLQIDRDSCLPKIQDTPSLTKEQSARILLQDILHLQSVQLDGVPSKWKLIVLSMAYWANALPGYVNEAHFFALALTIIVVNVIDEKIGYIRGFLKLKKRYPSILQPPPAIERKTNDGGGKKSAEEALNNVETNHCLFFMKEIIGCFEMDEKIRKNHRNFDVCIVDAFARFQSCLYYTKYLNLLLNCPFDDVIMSDYYNGTLAYNLCANFLTRTDLPKYVKLLMKHSDSVYALFESFTETVTAHCIGQIDKAQGKKRRRKKNKNKNKLESEELQQLELNAAADEDDDSEVYDVNNRFSALNLCV